MEQTASAAYPNVLVADYLRKAGRASKADVEKNVQLVREGFQRILTFQTPDGGFGWWSGGEDPQLWVTAYALHLLADTARVIEIDSAPIERARRWIRRRQAPDGSWGDPGQTHGVILDRTALTAYVAWALGGNPAAARWLEGQPDRGDAYRTALIALALRSSGDAAGAERCAARLAGMDWSTGETLSYGRGACARVETTGLAVQALVALGVAPESVSKGIETLVQARRDGDWGSTQATVQALRALTSASIGSSGKGERVKIAFRGAGGATREFEVVLGESAVPSVDLTELLGAGTIEVETRSDLSLVLQAVLRHHEKWGSEPRADLSLDVRHDDRWTLGRTARVSATLRGSGATMVIAEVGLAPGASPVLSSLEKLVESRRVTRFEVRPDRVVFYLPRIDRESLLEFDVLPRLKAVACVRPGCAYEFYDPDRLAIVPTARVSIDP